MLIISLFLSTFPLRGTSRSSLAVVEVSVSISIHVPLAGNVFHRPAIDLYLTHFYPRSPCGERPAGSPLCFLHKQFLSTFPLRGTSSLTASALTTRLISIHVPLAGNVQTIPCFYQRPFYFYPRSPCGERRHSFATNNRLNVFLSTFPLRGTSQPRARPGLPLPAISIHVPLAGNVRPGERI